MTGLIAGAGLGLLIMLATIIGHMLDRGAQDAAWRKVAVARRVNQETALRLQGWAVELETREQELEGREWRLAQRERRSNTD